MGGRSGLPEPIGADVTRYITLVLRYWLLVVAAVVGVTVAAGLVLKDAAIVSTIGGLFLGESPAYQRYVERTRVYGNDELLIVAIEGLDLAAPEARAQLARAVAALREHPDLGRITSLLDFAEVTLDEGALGLSTFAQAADAAGADAGALLQRLCRESLAGGLLISTDCRHAAVVVELDQDQGRQVEAYTQIAADVVEIFTRAGFEPGQLRQTGLVGVLAEVMHETVFNLTRLFPVVGVVLLLTVLLIFRQLWPVLITGVVALIGVTWTLGFGVLLFEQIDVFMALCPIFVLIIAFADVIHICSAYQLELASGADKREAIERACSEVGAACLFTSLTTFAGFVSIAVVPAPVFRQSGLILGFGVAISLLLALSLTPLLLRLLPEPTPLRRGAGARIQDLIDQLLAAISRLTQRRPWWVVGAFAVLAALAALGMNQIKVETEFSKRLAADNRIRVDQRFFQKHFAGANSLEVFVSSAKDGGLLEPALFTEIAGFADALDQIEGVDRVLSVVDLVREAQGLLDAEGQTPAGLPTTRAALAQLLLLLEMDERARLETLIDQERGTARLHLRLEVEGFMATREVGQAVRAAATNLLDDSVEVEVSGLTFLLGEWLQRLVEGQQAALMAALLTIFLMMVVALRSTGAGVWSMIPNALPLLVLLGYVGWAWDTVDSDTYIVCLVAIGVGVDDTIHFLMRYRRELLRSGEVEVALERTFAYSGRAIIMTSVILVAGFSPFSLSGYFTTQMFGTLLPACLVVALAAVLVLVPALISLGAFGFQRPEQEDEAA